MLWTAEASSKPALCFCGSHMGPSQSFAPEISSSLLFRGQSLLQELLDLVDICLHIPVEGQEGRMGAGG